MEGFFYEKVTERFYSGWTYRGNCHYRRFGSYPRTFNDGLRKKVPLKTAISNAKSAYNAVATWVAEQETAGTPWVPVDVTDIDCSSDGSGVQHVIYQALADNGDEAGIASVLAATINGKNTFAVQWIKASSDNMVGQYPNPASDPDSPKTWNTYS